MHRPSPFTIACERLDELVASAANLPTTRHTLETKADSTDTDPGYHVAADPIKLRQAETALVVALQEIRKRRPNLAAAGDYARRAVMLIETAGGPL